MSNNKQLKYGVTMALVQVALVPLSQPGLAQGAETPTRYVITNDNRNPNSATFFEIGGTTMAPTLTLLSVVGTGGVGNSNAPEGAKTVVTAKVGKEACAYVANPASNNITAIDIYTQLYAGIFTASQEDTGLNGLASNGTYFYASYGTSKTIAAFLMTTGCGLAYLDDVSAVGESNAPVNGMAAHSNILVTTFGNGSIESFNIAAGVPVSNGDLQYSTGHQSQLSPQGVDISQNGDYAVFGDQGPAVDVEVSDISSGKLTPTKAYANLGTVGGSDNLYLSPNDGLLYVSSNHLPNAEVTALYFNETTGEIAAGCSATPKNASGAYNLALELPSGAGGVVYAAEGSPAPAHSSQIGMFTITSSGKTCTLTEGTQSPSNSPVADSDGFGLKSIAVYPPRPF
jgi:hypothetical protein